MDNVHIKDTEQFYLHNRSNKLTTLEVHVEKHTWIESKNTSFFFSFFYKLKINNSFREDRGTLLWSSHSSTSVQY